MILRHTFLILLFHFSTATLDKVKIVQLGDSFACGAGGGGDDFLLNWDGGVFRCWRNNIQGWGARYAASLRDAYENVTYINRACAGAFLDDIVHPRRMDRFSRRHCPDESEWIDDEFYAVDGHHPRRCVRYVRPQIDAVDESVDLVLIIMGGNDAGFDQIIRFCLLLPNARRCRNTLKKGRETILDVVNRAVPIMVEVYDRMQGSGKVIWVQYPHIVLDVPRKIGMLWWKMDASKEVRDFTSFGNQQFIDIADQVNAQVGEKFVVCFNKTMDLFEGHEPNPYLGIRNRDRWLGELELSAPPFHPNEKGHLELSEALREKGPNTTWLLE